MRNVGSIPGDEKNKLLSCNRSWPTLEYTQSLIQTGAMATFPGGKESYDLQLTNYVNLPQRLGMNGAVFPLRLYNVVPD